MTGCVGQQKAFFFSLFAEDHPWKMRVPVACRCLNVRLTFEQPENEPAAQPQPAGSSPDEDFAASAREAQNVRSEAVEQQHLTQERTVTHLGTEMTVLRCLMCNTDVCGTGGGRKLLCLPRLLVGRQALETARINSST